MANPDEDFLVCMRIAGRGPGVVPGSAKKRCAECNAQVWVSPTGVQLLQTRKLRMLCMECARQQAKTEDLEIESPTPEQLDELRATLKQGFPDEIWQQLKEVIKGELKADEWQQIREALEKGGKPTGKPDPAADLEQLRATIRRLLEKN